MDESLEARMWADRVFGSMFAFVALVALTLSAVGLAIAFGLSWPLSPVLQSLRVRIPAQEPVTFAGITLLRID